MLSYEKSTVLQYMYLLFAIGEIIPLVVSFQFHQNM